MHFKCNSVASEVPNLSQRCRWKLVNCDRRLLITECVGSSIKPSLHSTRFAPQKYPESQMRGEKKCSVPAHPLRNFRFQQTEEVTEDVKAQPVSSAPNSQLGKRDDQEKVLELSLTAPPPPVRFGTAVTSISTLFF